jgi:hypothetical protein
MRTGGGGGGLKPQLSYRQAFKSLISIYHAQYRALHTCSVNGSIPRSSTSPVSAPVSRKQVAEGRTRQMGTNGQRTKEKRGRSRRPAFPNAKEQDFLQRRAGHGRVGAGAGPGSGPGVAWDDKPSLPCLNIIMNCISDSGLAGCVRR